MEGREEGRGTPYFGELFLGVAPLKEIDIYMILHVDSGGNLLWCGSHCVSMCLGSWNFLFFGVALLTPVFFGYWNHGCMEGGSVPESPLAGMSLEGEYSPNWSSQTWDAPYLRPLACATGSPPGAGCQSAHLALWHCKMRIYDMYLTIYIYDYVYEIIWVYI